MLRQNIELYRGDTASYTVEVFDELDKPVDLSNALVDMLVKPLSGSPIKPELTVAGHKIEIVFPASLTANLSWLAAAYDLQITRGEIVTTILRGNLRITQDITP